MSAAYGTRGVAQGPRAGLPSSEPAGIPLVCYICPQNGTFSDLSHLLTHISSKGHLAERFDLDLRRELDEEADIALVDFQNWYDEYQIADLLRARKTAKELKDNQQRGSRGGAGRGGRGAHRGGRLIRSRRALADNNQSVIQDAEDLNTVKLEVADDGDNDQADIDHADNDTFGWSGDYPLTESSTLRPSTIDQYDENIDEEEDETSSNREASNLYGQYGSEDAVDSVEDDIKNIVIKGDVFPGMSGFDAATANNKRLRNQKKDPKILAGLIKSSNTVTTNEEVLDMNLDWQRTRDIYDDPTDIESMDEAGTVAESVPTRRSRIKSETPFARSTRQRQPNPRSRQPAESTKKGRQRTKRRPARASRHALDSPESPVAIPIQPQPLRRSTRSTANMHSHGLHGQSAGSHERDQMLGNEGFEPEHRSGGRDLGRRHLDHRPGLALRPGNPNAFHSSASTFRKSPLGFPGKENNHLVLKSPSSSSNPYLHTSGNQIDNSSYNPLYVQPRDGFGYRLYSTYNGEAKASSTSSFHPINGGATYDSSHVPGLLDHTYHRNQSGGDDYGV